ncbi:MAG: hypothetical protein JJ969_03250 [Rhizobiaceae bacterium]|nr:hypothetical protein [Rhizobiaceae bacterium]MBO6727559.1 hypothetical protein [Rhizobiaceae bacterium]
MPEATTLGRGSIDAALLDAHARHDHAALVSLYAQAADMFEESGEEDAACFYLTHAYVFALEQGLPQQAGLHARLCAKGRDRPRDGQGIGSAAPSYPWARRPHHLPW